MPRTRRHLTCQDRLQGGRGQRVDPPQHPHCAAVVRAARTGAVGLVAEKLPWVTAGLSSTTGSRYPATTSVRSAISAASSSRQDDGPLSPSAIYGYPPL